MQAFFIALTILAVIPLAWFLFQLFKGRRIMRQACKDSLIVFGKKGHGKSLLFQWISTHFKTLHFKNGGLSNVPFDNCEKIKLNTISTAPNIYEEFLKGEIKPIKKQDYEGKPVLIDDAGVFLPNFVDASLKKQYPSMPLAFALWRHLYNAPIYLNSQTVSRAWKMLREQADGFIKANRAFVFLGFYVISCTYYDKLQSAENDLRPIRVRKLNAFQKGEFDAYNASNGQIVNFFVFGRLKKKTAYNTRYFRQFLSHD